MNNNLVVLAIGDVVGPDAVSYIEANLADIKREYNVSFTVINCENAAKDNGVDIQSAEALIRCGADVLTSGNHIWKRREIYNYLDDEKNIIRPANYPPEAPGFGYTIHDAGGFRVLVMNALGTVYMEALSCPFAAVEKILSDNAGKYDFSVLDIHAEATAEKLAMANYFDGKINVIFGTHTHVQTADERIFPNGTGYITDLGMTGPINSVLGVKPEIIIKKLRTHMPMKFEIASGKILLNGAVFTIDTGSGRVLSAKRITR